MKTLPAGLSAMLASGRTTLCRCWRVAREDGEIFGFTDHDRALTFGGTTYAAETGFTRSDMERTLSLAVDTMEVEGALSAAAITEEDIALGKWPGAEVEIYVVDWSDVANRVLLKAGNLGELVRGDIAFMAELRGLAHRLNQEQGRTYQRLCDAVLGDARCGIDAGDPDFSGTGSVLDAAENRFLTVDGLDDFDDGFFAQGVLTWTSGDNAGTAIEIRRHRAEAGPEVTLELWQAAPAAIEAGDEFDVIAGCDKTFPTCVARFDNAVNFRGFPTSPATILSSASRRRTRATMGGASSMIEESFAPLPLAKSPTGRGTPSRLQIVEEARSWIGTPYRHQGSFKGSACDCLGLIRGVWRAFYDEEPEPVPAYSSDWAEASGEETLLTTARKHLVEISEYLAMPGDVLVFRWKPQLPAKHCGILTSRTVDGKVSSSPRSGQGANRFGDPLRGRMVHAYDAAGKVAEGNLQAQWTDRVAGVFAFPGVG